MVFLVLESFFTGLIALTLVEEIQSLSVTISPDNDAFLLQRPNQQIIDGNVSRSSIYIHNGCVYNTEQLLTAQIGEQRFSLPLYSSMQNLYCAVAVKVVQQKISIEKPFVDIIVYRDHSWTNTFRKELCIAVKLENSNGSTVTNSCMFKEKDTFINTCLIRQEIPFSWFEINRKDQNLLRGGIKVLYSVGNFCSSPQKPLAEHEVPIETDLSNFNVLPLHSSDYGELSLLAKSNLSFTEGSGGAVLLHFRGPKKVNLTRLQKIEIKLWTDSRLELTSATALKTDSWSLKVASTAPPTFHTSFTLLFMEQANTKDPIDDYLLALMLKLKSQSDVLQALGNAKAVSLHWSIRYVFEKPLDIPETHIDTSFSVVPDQAYAIAALPRANKIINTAVISGVQTATSMHVFSVSEGGNIREVTDKSHCISSEPRLLKTSPTCTSVYVDGSEVRGFAGIEVHVQFRTLNTNAIFTVWYPKLPITVWVSDSTLNAISTWNIALWKDLPTKRRHSRNAKQFVCERRYQQTEIKILAAFHIVDEETGERTFLTGDRDLMFDVTQLAFNRIQSVDPSILNIKKVNGRLIGVAKKPGLTRLVIKTIAPAIDYGSIAITVSDERVSPTQLFVRPIANVHLNLVPQKNVPFQYELITSVQSYFTHPYQHGSLEIYIFYTDGHRELLSDVDTKEFSLSVFSNDEQTLRVTQQPRPPIVEITSLSDVTIGIVTVELHSSTYCVEAEAPPIVSGQSVVQTYFDGEGSKETQRRNSISKSDSLIVSNGTHPLNESGSWNLQPIVVILLALIFIVGLFHLITGTSRSLQNGYEKLVVPLLSKFSSSHSMSDDKDTDDVQEWIWMPKEQLDNRSTGSRYSQRSTLEMSEKSLSRGSSSTDEATRKSVSISYRGSEVSVFIAPQPSIAVHEDGLMSASLQVVEPLYVEQKGHHRYSSSSLLRPTCPERRVSDNTYFRSPNYYGEAYYQSIGHPRRNQSYDRNVRVITVNNGIKSPRITRPPPEYAGLRESIA